MEEYPNHLPREHEFSHNFCFYLHDLLADTLVSGEGAEIFLHHVELNETQHREFEHLQGEDIFEWLERNDRKSDALIIYYKQICAALLSDMLHFIYEALQCSRKGKLTVAFALLRKPLKENLFYLEWLLGNPVEFLERFDLGDSQALTMGSSLSPEHRQQIIRDALEKTETGKWIDAEFIYQIRYDKKASFAMEPLFQKAIHLVTTHRNLKTEGQNFNFVFSDHDSHLSQWDYLYQYLPILLFHSVQIVDALIEQFASRIEGPDLTTIRTTIGFALWMKHTYSDFDHDTILNEVRTALTSCTLKCEQCEQPLEFNEDQMRAIYEDYSLRCSKCSWSYDLHKLHEEK